MCKRLHSDGGDGGGESVVGRFLEGSAGLSQGER